MVRCVHCVTLPHGMHERVSPVWLASRNLLSKYVYKQNLLKFALSSSFVLQLVQQVRLPRQIAISSQPAESSDADVASAPSMYRIVAENTVCPLDTKHA